MNTLIDKQKVKRAFDRASDSYDKVSQLQQEMGNRLLSRLDYIRIEPKIIVDMGSGTGALAEKLAKRYKKSHMIAADFAHGMLLKARQRGTLWRKMRCLCADAERLPLATGSIDLLISNAMLQWSNHPEVIFSEWIRVIKPGGLLLFTTFGEGTLKELQQAWADVDRHNHVSRFADMHDLGDALVGGGWESPVMDIDRFTLTYEDVRSLMLDIKGLGASHAATDRLKGLTGKGRMQAMIDSYDSYRTNGLIPASYEVIYGLAWAPKQKKIGDMHAISLATLREELAHSNASGKSGR
jgi:malonyl-CoA O-methyltransferase